MKNRIAILSSALIALALASCSKRTFTEYYVNPSKIETSTVSKQYAGFLDTNVPTVVPHYWAYFTSYVKGATIYTQSLGTINVPSLYVAGAGVMDVEWDYFKLLFQYRELERIYNALPQADQDLNRIFMLTATIYLYDFTQRAVNVYGDLPFSEAGKITQNLGNYETSLPKYDSAEEIYTKILDDLKMFSEELNTISVPAGAASEFKTQDFLNGGDLDKWKRYCNSLRVRMLNTVSAVNGFSERATAELAEILADPAKYPLVSTNAESIHYLVVNTNTGNVNSKGLEGVFQAAAPFIVNLAGKRMIDYMNLNSDPRRRVFFEIGENSRDYVGLDPLLDQAAQNALAAQKVLATVNRNVFSYNQKLPGEIINAAQMSFTLAEYYLRIGDDAKARTAYESGIRQSIEYYFSIAATSDATIGTKPAALGATEISDYIAAPGVSWSNATTNDAKRELIATQLWIHYGWMQPMDSWTDSRRTDLPKLDYWRDTNTGAIINLPPNRYLYPSSERQYNADNYKAVAQKDSYTTKIFWDARDYRELNP